MRVSLSKPILGAVLAMALSTGAAHAEWQPAGPIKVLIGFNAGGGADTQARLIAEDIAARKGWTFIPENITGKGGANMLLTLKAAPADGLTIGMSVTEAITYTAVATPEIGFAATDFTYLATTAPTQMGLVAKAATGWRSLADVAAAAKAGEAISFSYMSPRLEDGVYAVGDKLGVKFNPVSVNGGKGSLDAIVAGDVKLGWVAGIQAKGVQAGDLVNLVSAEDVRLDMSPNAPTLREEGIPFSFGTRFVMVAPAGLSAEARAALSGAIAEVLADPASKSADMIAKGFGGTAVATGADIDALIDAEVKDAAALIKLVR